MNGLFFIFLLLFLIPLLILLIYALYRLGFGVFRQVTALMLLCKNRSRSQSITVKSANGYIKRRLQIRQSGLYRFADRISCSSGSISFELTDQNGNRLAYFSPNHAQPTEISLQGKVAYTLTTKLEQATGQGELSWAACE